MPKKTWKIGERCRGGIITAETTAKKVAIIGKDWDFSKGTKRGSDQSQAKEWTRLEVQVDEDNAERKIRNFIEDLCDYYHADMIVEWIETKVELKEKFGW